MRQRFVIAPGNAVNVNDFRARERGLQIRERIVAIQPQMPHVNAPADRHAIDHRQDEIERIALQILDGQPLRAACPLGGEFEGADRVILPRFRPRSRSRSFRQRGEKVFPIEMKHVGPRAEGARALDHFARLDQRNVAFITTRAQPQVERQVHGVRQAVRVGQRG